MNVPVQFTPRFAYSIWLKGDDHRLAHREQISAASLAQIEERLCHPFYQRATIFVLENDSVNEVLTLHTYRVRKGQWLGRYDEQHRKAYPYKADRLFSLPVETFEPVEPWRYEPGCDVVGAGATIIEGSVA